MALWIQMVEKRPMTMASDDVNRLLATLDTGDLELYFHDGRSVRVHGEKLKRASLGGVLHNLMEDVLGEQIESNRKTVGPLNLQVSSWLFAPILRAVMYPTCSAHLHGLAGRWGV